MNQRSSPNPYAPPTTSVDHRGGELLPPITAFDIVLVARGWQVFALLLSSWLLPLGVFLAVFPEPSSMSDHPTLFLSIMVLQELAYFGWCVSVALAMNARLPLRQRHGHRLPLYSLAAVVASMLSFAILVGIGGPWESYLAIAVVLSVVVNLYLLWFVGRSLVAAEEQRPQRGLRILGIVLGLWVSLSLPVGAWLVHERARRVARFAPREQ